MQNAKVSLEKPCPERRHNDYLPIESQWDSGVFGLIWGAPRSDWNGHSNMPRDERPWLASLPRFSTGDAVKLVPNPSVDRVYDGPLS